MESINPCTEEVQDHTLEWAYWSFGCSGHIQEHGRKSSSKRAMALGAGGGMDKPLIHAGYAPVSSEYCRDGFNAALPNVERNS